MTGLVDQLQADATDPQVSVSTLLRRVKIAAVKLGLDDAVAWVDKELKGYTSDVPDYRKAMGQLVGFNPYQGWQPILFRDDETNSMVSSVELREPIGNYEDLLLNADSEGGYQIQLAAAVVARMNRILAFEIPRAANSIARGTVVRVVEHVRGLVLDWSLELARAGVTGDGMTFSSDERKRASGAQVSIGTFHGSFNTGDAVGPNARVNIASTDQSSNRLESTSVFAEIRSSLEASGLSAERLIEVDTRLAEMAAAKDKGTFAKAYQSFVGTVADHITVVAPFLPAITEALSRLS